MLLDTRLMHRLHAVRRDNRVPEVVIKVISAGSSALQGIREHFEDLQNGRHRTLGMDCFNTPVVGKRAAQALIDDWDLDLDNLYWRQPYLMPRRKKAPKLVHKILFSMPPGTPPEKLLAAVRSFAQQEFADRHRYALALHLCGVVVYVERLSQTLVDRAPGELVLHIIMARAAVGYLR